MRKYSKPRDRLLFLISSNQALFWGANDNVLSATQTLTSTIYFEKTSRDFPRVGSQGFHYRVLQLPNQALFMGTKDDIFSATQALTATNYIEKISRDF